LVRDHQSEKAIIYKYIFKYSLIQIIFDKGHFRKQDYGNKTGFSYQVFLLLSSTTLNEVVQEILAA
jgi:hypothetical protein